VLELTKDGTSKKLLLTPDEFITSLGKHRLPFRDVKMLLKASQTPGGKVRHHPALLPRPSSCCFILEMEHINLICFSDKCLILNPDHKSLQALISSLNLVFRCQNCSTIFNQFSSFIFDTPACLFQQRIVPDLDFEHVILENVLENVVGKFRKHLQTIKPALEILLQQIVRNPKIRGLKKLLAVKKGLTEFEQFVDRVMRVVRTLLGDDSDMKNLYLTSSSKEKEPKEVEMLLGSYLGDLDEIETQIRIFIDLIEDTEQFTSTHLDSSRNAIIKMRLFMEIGALIMTFGAVVISIFSMNLSTALKIGEKPWPWSMEAFGPVDDAPWAFIIVSSCVLLAMFLFFVGLMKKYYHLHADTSKAQNFARFKNFITYDQECDIPTN